MHRKWIAIVVLIAVLFTALPSAATADVITSSVPEIDATSYIVIDGATGEILFGKNYQQQCAPASITKIMTAILAIESGKLDNEITVPEIPDFGTTGAVTIHLGKWGKIHTALVSRSDAGGFGNGCSLCNCRRSRRFC